MAIPFAAAVTPVLLTHRFPARARAPLSATTGETDVKVQYTKAVLGLAEVAHQVGHVDAATRAFLAVRDLGGAASDQGHCADRDLSLAVMHAEVLLLVWRLCRAESEMGWGWDARQVRPSLCQ